MSNISFTIQQYELKICSAINKIMEIEKMVEQKQGIRTYSKKNPEKIVEAVLTKCPF